MESSGATTFVLKVNLPCGGCPGHRKEVNKVVKEKVGVDPTWLNESELRISGSADPQEVIEELRKKGKTAKLVVPRKESSSVPQHPQTGAQLPPSSKPFNLWIITLVGALLIMGNRLILHSTIMTAVILYLICASWYHLNSNSNIGSDSCPKRKAKKTKKNQTSHSSNEHDYELKNYKKRFTCNGCKEEGYGPRYRCKHSDCDYELHKECKTPEPKISHELLKESTLTFYKKQKQPTRCCIACGRDICGYVYGDEVKGRSLHPCCSNLKPKFTNNNVTFRLGDKASSKCMWCNKKGQKTHVSGWSYISTCNKYRFHVYCVPEMMHEAWKKGNSMTLEEMDLSLLHGRRSKKYGARTFFKETVKIVGLLVGAAVDPTGIIAGVVPIAVELFSNIS